MKERVYNKLVRDNIPDIIRQQGETPVIRTLEDGEFLRCLAEKTLNELGDILEVLEAMAHLQGWTDGEIRRAKEEKAQRNGAFRERVFLEKVLEEG